MKHQRNANSARKPSTKGRRVQRRGIAERRQLLDRYERSGLSQKAFCLRHGVALSTLQYWRRRARDADQELRLRPSFVEVPQVTRAVRALSEEAAVIIELPGGTRLEVHAGTDSQWLSGLVRAMGTA
jgi:transposase-like protein